MTATSYPQVARQSTISEGILEAESREGWGRGHSSRSEVLESRQPLQMWKEQALPGREGEVQTTSPTTNDPLLARDGKGRAGHTQQLMTGRQAQAEGGRGGSRVPRPLPPKCLQSAETVWSSNPPPTCPGSLLSPPGRVGQGGVIKTKNQTYPRRPRGDQVRPVHRVAASWVPHSWAWPTCLSPRQASFH